MRKSVRGKNHFEATRLVDLILQAGISQCYVSPGSRSTPLVEAIAEAAELNAEVHFDERGAAFAALGYGRATGRAAALVCTSGTAVANYFPAVIEAFQSGIPLLVISADRPLEAINTGANQTIDQREIFGPFVRISLDFEKVDDEVEQALSQLANGPVHLNMRFSKPLLGEEIPGPLPKKFVLVSRQDQVNPQDLECLRQLWEQSSNPLIVVGQFDRSIKIEQLFRELVKLRAPVVATALSGLRAYSTEAECLLCHYEFYLEQLKVFPPDLVLHLGRAQPSIALDNFLEKIRPPMLVIDENCQNFDPYGSLRLRIQANPVGLLSRLKLSCKETKLGQAAKIFERRASIAIQAEADQSSMSEWGLAKILSEQLERGEGMFLSSSLPVREADACISKHAEDLQITSNRGVSGIDGTVASAVGFCQGLGKPVTLVLGDLALLHDLNSLSMVKAVPLTIVAINNDGGGIFELLPIKQQVDSSRFEKFWGTPQEKTVGVANPIQTSFPFSV